MITRLQLDGYVGKAMKEICANRYVHHATDDAAHFVGHVLRLQFAPTCHPAGGSRQSGASTVVSAIFARCPAVGAWSLRPSGVTTCLVFSTPWDAVHLPTKVMRTIPRQQVGIFLNGFVWHYSPLERRVARQTVASFADHRAAGFVMLYGTLPSP